MLTNKSVKINDNNVAAEFDYLYSVLL